MRPKGPMDPGWRPADPVGRALMLDILERLTQHRAEDTLPRSPRGLFYDLRPNGMGHGLSYVKQPPMWCVRGEHIIDGEGRCRLHEGGSRRADPRQIGPIQVQEMLVKLRRAGLVREDWIEDAGIREDNLREAAGESARVTGLVVAGLAEQSGEEQ